MKIELTQETFTFHQLLNKYGVKDSKLRIKLGIELSAAYKMVNGKAAPKKKIGKWLKVRVYPIGFLGIAENTIKTCIKSR